VLTAFAPGKCRDHPHGGIAKTKHKSVARAVAETSNETASKTDLPDKGCKGAFLPPSSAMNLSGWRLPATIRL
jgi:hypothetical protein